MTGRLKRLRTMLLLGGALLAVGTGLLLDATGALKRLELTSVDLRFHVRGDQPAPDDVVVVGIDSNTFDRTGLRWPFSRAVHAKVIRQLEKAKPAAIAYDVQFTESTGNSEAAIEADNALILSVRRAGDVVLATTEVADDGSTRIFGGADGLKFSRGIPANSNYENDVDGRIRRVPFEIQELESFPLAAARVARGRPVETPDGDSTWIDYAGGAGSVRQLSFGDVLAGDFPEDAVRDKVVVVGATAPSLQDRHLTSTSGSDLMPGPEIQATAAATALAGFPIQSAPGWISTLAIVLLGLGAPLAAIRLRVVLALALGVGLIAAYVVAAQLAFGGGTIVTVVYALVAGVIALIVTALAHGLTVAFERERVRDAFARFVPETVVDQVLRDADGVRLGGVRRDGTVMFSDLRGFTSFAETLDPELVINSLNRYLTEMSEAILDHGGTLVAYMGDGIMAVFGAPLQQDDHADRALAAAREMLERLESFNAWLREQELHEGFKMGIGLNSGPVMSGNVGSERRLEYTALGDTTNTAARLEGMTKGTPYQLYVSDTTRRALTRAADDLVEVGDLEVRGRKATVTLWSLPADEQPAPAEPPPPASAGR